MDNLTFTGVDIDLEISMFEYGIILSNEEHTDGSHTHFAVYMIDEDHFGTSHITEKEVDEIGRDGFGSESSTGFTSWLGDTIKDWLKLPMINKLSDILNYYGYQNVFGTEYNPVSKEFVSKQYLKLEI